MKKKKLLFFSGSILTLAVSLFTLNAIKNVDVSYAQLEGVPTTDFKTNVTASTEHINLVGQALGSNSQIAVNFDVEKDIKYGNYPLYKLTKNRVTPANTETFEINGETVNPMDVNDAGLKRILQVGYSNISHAKTVFNANNYGSVTDTEKEYITQIAIWIYLYENEDNFATTYCKNEGCEFFNSSTFAAVPLTDVYAALNRAVQNNGKLKYIQDILSEAENASIVPSQNPFIANASGLSEYTFYDDHILTGEFKFTSVFSNDFISYDVSVKQNGYGIYLTDSNGDKLGNGTSVTGLSPDTKVRLYIPITGNLENMDLSNCGLNYTVYSLFNNNYVAKAFTVTNTTNTEVPLIAVGANKTESFSDVLFGSSEIKSIPGDATLHNFTVISKRDAVTSDEIPGAHLSIYDIDDMNDDGKSAKENATPIKSWVSEANKSYKLFLEDGEYGLCETIIPDGYGSNEAGDITPTCITFEVNNSSVTVQQMLNYPIPNTGLFKSKISYTVGGALIIIGILGMVVVLGNDKKKQQKQSEQEQQSM